ncbi:MAG: hypothetical protein ACHQ51_13340 [Elusimicrobiota bacterium]
MDQKQASGDTEARSKLTREQLSAELSSDLSGRLIARLRLNYGISVVFLLLVGLFLSVAMFQFEPRGAGSQVRASLHEDAVFFMIFSLFVVFLAGCIQFFHRSLIAKDERLARRRDYFGVPLDSAGRTVLRASAIRMVRGYFGVLIFMMGLSNIFAVMGKGMMLSSPIHWAVLFFMVISIAYAAYQIPDRERILDDYDQFIRRG